MVDEVFQQRCVQDRLDLHLLPSDGRADDGEDAGTDDGADSEGGQAKPPEGFLQFYFGIFGVRQKLIDTLTVEELGSHSYSPFASEAPEGRPVGYAALGNEKRASMYLERPCRATVVACVHMWVS